MDKTLTIERIDAFQSKLHTLLLQQAEINKGRDVKDIVFDRLAFKKIFEEYGFDERWQWLTVDFEETDAVVFLGQLQHADVDQLGSWRMLIESGVDLENIGKFNRDDYVQLRPRPDFGPED